MRRFKNVLCVLDRQPSDGAALCRAVALAENNQARLTVVTVTERIPEDVETPESVPEPGDLQASLTETQIQRLKAAISPYTGRIEISTKVLAGIAFLEIIREVLRSNHDLVIKCPESPSWLNRFFSGDDMHLLRKCPCPVWLVNPETADSYQRILAAVDVDDNYPPAELKTRRALNDEVIELASSLAVSEFAELHVVHVWEAFGESALRHSAFLKQPEDKVNAYVGQLGHHHARLLEDLMDEMGTKLGPDAMDYVKPQRHLIKGSARKEIPSLAKRLQVDCVVMGTVARTGVRGFIMGNTAETILEQIDCSVIAIKPTGFVTPVTLGA